MKIFLTGATGFIGKNLAERWQLQGHEVRCYVRGESCAVALSTFAPDAVVNCAAEIYDPSLMFSANVELVRAVLEHALSRPAVKVIQIGSSAEYGPVDRPSAETDALRPVDMYQATKGAATLLCQGYARQHGLDVCVARPYSVYGPHERPRRLFPRLVRAFGEGEAMTLFEGFHDFIHGAHGCHRGTVLTRPPVDDFGRGIDLLLAAGRQPGVQTSNFEVLRLFEQAAGRPAPAVERKEALAKAFESTVWVCNTEHSRATLGFEARVGLADGIKALLLAGTPQQPGVAP